MIEVEVQTPAPFVTFQLVANQLGNEVWSKPARDLAPDATFRKSGGRFRQLDGESSHGLQNLAHGCGHRV
ncbi:MAG: hypothetical protein WDO73_09680 [Ignavibacteriota bacterium]